ncbi:cysteine desulfurase family protein [Dyadobacter sp. Leaf189]|uniref:cysteine desulfurase family protein n=1 Tax=Dyadobacter sp. Leaf189 TaxID=1736295 RepID=UPI0006FEE299|nr:cysteine desulfurase family protein [Dyadobacter sp. Leaf189]KQS33108.1 cysteine desulfurase [Dyadobacter sp. Leaf189]
MKAYLDNAATTQLDPEVLEVMLPLMTEQFGNPSSIHSYGRAVRSSIERARKSIAGILNAAPAEIFFTSGGTEADNTAIRGSIETLGLKHAVTSRIEHHAVLHTLEHLSKAGTIKLSYVNLNEKGEVDLEHLETLLATNSRSLVSLMHGNNEIGNLLDLEATGDICEKYNAVFHSDTVQTMGHFPHDLQKLKANFIVGAAHKFNGPKGVGFLYVRPGIKIAPFVHGGAQERNMRGGTENIYGIVGLAKALEIAYRDMDAHRQHIEGLKSRMIENLRSKIDGVSFNGNSADLGNSLYTVLSVSLPPSDISDMLLFNLDIAGIAVSGGSACSSGTDIGSHVLNELQIDPDRANVRFSFGKYNTEAEIDYAVNTLADLYKKEAVSL